MSQTDLHTTDQVAPVFAALGNPIRLELVARLADREAHSITSLGDGLSLTRQAVRKHLDVLEDAGIVAGERSGRQHLFRVEPGTFAAAQDYLARVSAQWDDAILRLKTFVEDDDSDGTG